MIKTLKIFQSAKLQDLITYIFYVLYISIKLSI